MGFDFFICCLFLISFCKNCETFPSSLHQYSLRKSLILRGKGGGFGKPSSTISTRNLNPRNSPDPKGNVENSGFNPIRSDEIVPIPLASIDLSQFNPNFNLQYPGLRAIHSNPPIFEIENFFDHDLCEEYIRRAQDCGVQVASQTFSSLTSTARTSTTWYLHYSKVTELLSKAKRVTNFPIYHYEEPQIVRYELGQQFSWHYDAVPPKLLVNGGQRIMTLLVYLNNVEAGGATCFKELNLKVQPKKGKALLFFPSFLNGTSDDRTFHAGQVAFDTKWIAQMWIHQYNYTAVIPEKNYQVDALPGILQYESS